MTSWRRFITIAFVAVISGLSIAPRYVMAIEEANYSILEKEGGFELRQSENPSSLDIIHLICPGSCAEMKC